MKCQSIVWVALLAACNLTACSSSPVRNIGTAALRCTRATSNALLVEWDADQDADRYYVALCESLDSRPFALQTSAGTNLTVHDLVPETTYYLRLRSHPAVCTSCVDLMISTSCWYFTCTASSIFLNSFSMAPHMHSLQEYVPLF
eukprot:m.79599 g.79599  ORF g.79599 m.79599 type:complete len:145 (+) comp16277_c0_seq4:86-520(+)